MSTSGMRIERRGGAEYLIGGPAGLNDCTAEYEGHECNVHFDGQHMVTCDPGEDGAELIYYRWPIEPAATPGAAPLRPAEEIAREMVPDAGWLQLGTDGVRLASDVSVPHARAILTSLVEQSRAEGAAAERGRIFAAASGKPADLAAVAMAAAGMNGEADYARGRIAEIEQPQARLGTAPAAQPSTIADAIRALIQDYAGRWADTENYDDTIALHDVMSGLRTAFCAAKHQDRAALDGAITWMRRRAARRTRSGTRSSIQAAADLEAIIARHGGAK